MIKQYSTQCYYVKVPDGPYGYFTITEELGLLQIQSDYGVFSHRWSAPGPDFKAFLTRISTDYASGCFETIAYTTIRDTTRKIVTETQQKLDSLMTHLWPLFIEQLKQERAQSATATGAPIAITRYTVGGLERSTHYYEDCPARKAGDILQTTLGVGHPEGVCGVCVQRMGGKRA